MSSFEPYNDARTLLQAANLVAADHIHWANEPFVQPQDSLWLSVDAYSNTLDALDLGAGKWQERGTLLVWCCAPVGIGTDTLRTLAKAVCSVYRGLPPRNPYYHGAGIGNGGLGDSGDYFVLPVSIQFVFED